MSVKKAPAKKPAAKPAAAKRAPAKAPAAKPVAAKAAAKSAATKVVAKPAVKTPAKPVLKSVPEPVVKSAAKPALKSVPKPVVKIAAKPAAVPAQPAAKKSVVDLVSFHDFKPYKLQKGEEYMNDAQVAHFREILMAWKKALMEEVDRTVHHMQDEAANFPDPNDRATQESEFSMELRTRDRERKLIKKIDEALSNLDTREYGFCDSCGIEIGIRRLEARPTASQCIDCKTLDEIREKQMGT